MEVSRLVFKDSESHAITLQKYDTKTILLSFMDKFQCGSFSISALHVLQGAVGMQQMLPGCYPWLLVTLCCTLPSSYSSS